MFVSLLVGFLASLMTGLVSVLFVECAVRKESKWYFFARHFLVVFAATVAGIAAMSYTDVIDF